MNFANLMRSAAGIALAGSLALAAAPALAQQFSAEQQAALRQASVYISSISDVQGDFVQIGPNGDRTNGKFYISRPGKVRFDYARPSPLQLIADGKAVVVRDRKLNTQDVYPLGQTPLRYLLASRLDLAKDAKVIGVYETEDGTTIVIEDSSIAGTGRLAMAFDAKFELSRWTVTDPQGLETTVMLDNVTFGRKMDPKTFEVRYKMPNMP